jgi:LacI family transcriptional regulator
MKKSTHATLSEVARQAGVGTTTVSRVINGGHRVSPETLARVHAVIEHLGYMPNQAARTLKGDRTRTIGLIIPSIADSFFSSCAEAAQVVARAHDSLLIVTTTQNSLQTEIDNLNVLIRHRADGIIIAPGNSQNQELQDLLNRIHVPVVAIDRPVANSLIPSVVTDNFKGACSATEHLIGHGYKSIVCFTGESNLYTIRERIRGYHSAMAAAGLLADLETSIHDRASAEKAIEKLLKRPDPPQAIFALKNSTTIYAFETLQRLNVQIPSQMAILGFDDFELASIVRPAISVVQQPVEEIGRVAAELLFEHLLEDRKAVSTTASGHSRTVVLNNHLILRGSCGCS